MNRITLFLLLTAALTFVAACETPAPNTAANNANTSTTNPAAAAPTVDALMALERQANEAFAKGDSRFFQDNLSDKFVILANGQRMDKATTVKMIGGVKCDIKSMDLSEPGMSMIDADTYALAYKATWEVTCDGLDGKPMKVPSPVRSASVWIRNADKWQAVFHGENLIIDPKASPSPAAKPEAKTEERKQDDKTTASSNATPSIAPSATTAPDANTDSLVKVELALWQAWKEHDANKLDALMAKEVSFVNIFGTYLGTRVDAMKDWTGNGCEVRSVSVTDGFATALSPKVAMLTRKGTADGTCGGQEIGGTDIWGVSIFVKVGDAWKFAFGMNLAGG